MKLSISLSEKDIAFIDKQIAENGELSRSAVIRKAVELLRDAEIERLYAEYYGEWWDEEESALWDVILADGLEDEPDAAW